MFKFYSKIIIIIGLMVGFSVTGFAGSTAPLLTISDYMNNGAIYVMQGGQIFGAPQNDGSIPWSLEPVNCKDSDPAPCTLQIMIQHNAMTTVATLVVDYPNQQVISYAPPVIPPNPNVACTKYTPGKFEAYDPGKSGC